MKSSKYNNKYIEVLGEKGWYKQQISTTDIIDKKKAFFFKSALILFLLTLITIPLNITTYSKYKNEVYANNTLRTAKWIFNVNGKTDNISINLEDTIINNDTKVIPGTSGKINIQIDFSGSEVASKYTISKDETSILPSNLKLYTDSNLTEEFNNLTSSVGLDNINEVIATNIYWKWNYTLEDESQWMNKNISLKLKIDLSEDVGDTNV